MESGWWSRLWRRLFPIRFYASAAGGWYLHINKRGFHITEVDFSAIWKPAPDRPDRRPIWLRREGEHAVVLVEENGEFREIIREFAESPFSHIWEDRGFREEHEVKA